MALATYRYTLINGDTAYEVTCNNKEEVTKAIIPSSYNGLPVTSIGEGAFHGCPRLTRVNIPDGVVNIEDFAFMDCSNLTSVTIPDSVICIGEGALYGCTRLTRITIKATTPPYLGGSAFGNTNNCPIYVPAQSVEAYKTATNWSSLASRIFAIQE